MGTSYIELYPGPITLPDGSAGNLFCQAEQVKSSGTPPTNGPNLHFEQLLFDGAADEHAIFTFYMPGDYSSGGTANILWKRKSGTVAANVVWKGAVAAVTPGAAEVPDTKSFNTVATTTTAAGTTANALVTTAIALTMDGAAAGDKVAIMIGRDADNAADTLDAVDACVVAIRLDYTTA